jgi:antitoxin (DNA-binding transcriptional repressor) of toxin-antitoxin stability system
LTDRKVQLKMTQTMNAIINAKELRAALPEVVAKVRRGARFTVLYRSRPAFQVVPVDAATGPEGNLEDDPLYRAKPLGRSTDGRTAADHDAVLYSA